MESIISDAHPRVEPDPFSVVPQHRPAPLNVRWGRTILALSGVLALLTAGISGALSVFNIGSAAITWTGLGLFLAVLVGLRALAVRDVRRRRAAVELARTTAAAQTALSPTSAVAPRETALFDRVLDAPAETADPVTPLTAEELRAAALRVAAQGTADAKLAHTQTLAAGDVELETWEPVEVPVPGYVTAARAVSFATALSVPEVPKSAGTSIKADQAGIAEPTEAPVALAGGRLEGPAERPAVKTAKTGYALNNLDDVLQRRRA